MTKHKSFYNENDDPCFKEHEMTYTCLKRNNYEQKKCTMYFDNYNVCKKFWGAISTKRRDSGITPHMPDAEERKKIKEEYAKNIKPS